MKKMWPYRLLCLDECAAPAEIRAQHAALCATLGASPGDRARRARYDEALEWLLRHCIEAAEVVVTPPSNTGLPMAPVRRGVPAVVVPVVAPVGPSPMQGSGVVYVSPPPAPAQPYPLAAAGEAGAAAYRAALRCQRVLSPRLSWKL